MTKRSNNLTKPHLLPYAIAGAAALGLPIIVVLTYVFVSGYDARTFEDNILIIAIAMVPIWWAVGAMLSTKPIKAALPLLADEDLRDRVSRATFIGVLGAVFMFQDVSSVWSIATQFIGGTLVLSLAFLFYEYVADWLLAGLKRMWQNK